MKRIKRIVRVVLVFIIILTTSACINMHKGETFEKFSNDFFLSIIGYDEITINNLFKDREAFGFEHYDPSLPEPYVPSGSGGSVIGDFLGISVQGYLKRLAEFDFDTLTKDQQITYLIIKDVLERSQKKETYMYYLDSSYLGSYLGYQAQLPLLFAEYSFYDVDDIESYIKIVNLVEPTFEKYYQFEVEKADKGYGMPDFVIDKVIAQCERITNDIDDHFLIPVFNDKIDGLDFLSESEKSRYKNLHEVAIKTSFYNGYIYLKDNLSNLKGRATNNQGLYHYEGGKEFYQFLFNQVTGYDIKVDDALSYLENNLRKRIISYVNLLQNNEGLVEEINQTILLDFDSPMDLVNYHREHIKTSFPSIDDYDIDVSVKYIHKSMENNFSPAAYVISPIDETSSEFIYLNAKSVNDRPNYLFVTLAHEGFPGHLYQNVYFKNQEVNIIRKVLRNIGYVEGWATYAEMYSYRFSEANPTVVEAIKLNDEINGIITAILDICIHYLGYGYDDIISYLETNLGPTNPEVDYQALYNQLVEVPTNSQQYFFTYLKFVDMYEKAQKKLGTSFNEKEYHKLILDLGPIPLKFVEQEVDKYLASK
jgi:uncharacterized protein (DUF885 family)